MAAPRITKKQQKAIAAQAEAGRALQHLKNRQIALDALVVAATKELAQAALDVTQAFVEQATEATEADESPLADQIHPDAVPAGD